MKQVIPLWDTSDRLVAGTANREIGPSLEVRHNSVNDNEIYLACELWQGSAAQDKILIKWSVNHGNIWIPGGVAFEYANSKLSSPRIAQVTDRHMGVVFGRKLIDSEERDILFWRHPVDFSGDWGYSCPDNSTGTNDGFPVIASDYIDYPSASWVYVAYHRLEDSGHKLLFVRSTDSGITWEEPVILSSSPLSPAYQVASLYYDSIEDVLWLAYIYKYSDTTYRFLVLKSEDYGQTWEYLIHLPSSNIIDNVSITALGNKVWVAENTGGYTYIVYSEDSGNTWQSARIDGELGIQAYLAQIKTTEGSNYVYCVFTKNFSDVTLARAPVSSPGSFTTIGNVKDTSAVLHTSAPLGLLVSRNPSGQYQASVSWTQEFGSSDYNIYFDAEWLPQPAAIKMDVVPGTNFVSGGAVGGPFSPSAINYMVENTGTESLNYSVYVDQAWVTLSNTEGTLAAGRADPVTVSINSNAASLPLGTYTATITFINTTNGVGNSTRTVTLYVVNTPAQLSVTPSSGVGFDMFRGGPAPANIASYTLQNTGQTPLNWTATKTKSWLSLGKFSGTLLPSASEAMSVYINSNCLTLSDGNYVDTIIFTNTTNGNGNTPRDISLTVHNEQYFIVQGTDNRLYKRIMNKTGWMSPWTFINGLTDKSPASAIFNNRVNIFVKSNLNNDIWYGYIVASGMFRSWMKIDGATPDKMSAAVFNNRLYLAVRGTDNRIYIRYMDTAGTFSSWSVVPGGATTTPPAIAAFNNYLYLVVKDATDNKIWWNKMDTAGTWSGWQLMDGMSPSTAAVSEFNGLLYIFVRGTDNRIYYRTMNTLEVFSSWTGMSGFTDDSPAICNYQGRGLLYLLVKGLGSNQIWYNSMTPGGVWGSWTLMTDGASPATASVSAPRYSW